MQRPSDINKNNFKCLTPEDPEFLNYMMGSFSDFERAIPQPSLNIQANNEVVTFEIKKVEDLEPASTWKKWWLLLKPQTWLTVLVPLIMISRVDLNANFGITVELAIILSLLMVFSTWQADLADHLEGWDRLHGAKNKSVLQNGWFTGLQLQRWSQWIMGFNFVLGIPLLLNYPWILIPYSTMVLILLMLMPKWWRKSVRPGISSFCIFLLSGPLLTIGIDLVFDGKFSKNSLFLGVAWGIWMSFIRQQKIYTRQWRHYQKQSPYNFLGLGFDKAKSLMRLLIITIPGTMLFPLVFVNGGAAWFFPLLVVHSVFVFWELHFNEQIMTSISSSLKTLEQIFQWHFYLVSLMMIIGAIVWKTTLH